MSDLLIRAEGLTKAYGSKVALQDVDLSIGRGRIIGLLGPNGSGKTTLIKLLCGLLQPTLGTLLVDDAPVGVHSKSVISYLPDRMYFADWMKATDLFDLFADFYADFDRTKAMHMCAALGVNPGRRGGPRRPGLYSQHDFDQLQRGGDGAHLHPPHQRH